MRINLYIVFLAISFTLGACTSSNDCFVSDVVDEVKSVTVDSKEYYLFLRTSGFNEKEHFYELYDHKPKFDDCGLSKSTSVSDVHVDSTVGNVGKVVISDKSLNLVYSKDVSALLDLRKVTVETN